MDSPPNRWLEPVEGWPTLDYFEAVVAETEKLGVDIADWRRDEPWEFTIELGKKSRLDWAAMFVSWVVSEDSDIIGDQVYGLGWYWVPYSDPQKALGEFAKEFNLDVIADPADVARAIQQLVNPTLAAKAEAS